MDRLTANEIIGLLEEPTEDRQPIKMWIAEAASSSDFAQALEQATNPLTKEILCDIAGDRFEQAAVQILIRHLHDPSEGVRASAADALGKIGDIQAGPSLLEQFIRENQVSPVRSLLASALGAVGYRQAVPILIQALEDPDPVVRGCAAWGLGIMCAIEAEGSLRDALSRESEPPRSYTKERLDESLEALELVNRTLGMTSRKKAITLLLSAIERDRWAGVRTTSAAWGLGKLQATEAVKPLARLLLMYPKGFLAEHLRTALKMIEKPDVTY